MTSSSPAKGNVDDERALYGPLVILILVAAIAVVAVGGTYFSAFRGSLSTSQEIWGQFGDYLGGTLNPILGFLSFVAVIMTLAVQTRQLQLTRSQLAASREELEATRQELARSADANAATAEALRQQATYSALSAKAAAISALLSATDKQLAHLRDHPYAGSGSIGAEMAELTQRRDQLMGDLRAMSARISKHSDA